MQRKKLSIYLLVSYCSLDATKNLIGAEGNTVCKNFVKT